MYQTLKKEPNNLTNLEVFDFLYAIDKQLFIRAVREIFLYDERKVLNEIFFYLNKLNNGKNFFITTNIDISFQKYLGLGDENISINPNFSNPPKLINYLHGRIDREDTWIFTTAQYNRAYNSNENGCRSFLQYIFETYNVLFIGYGLREDDIKRIIYLTNELTNRRKTHFGLEGIYKDLENTLVIRSTSLRENYNIILIPYNIEREGHKLLYKVIDSLSDIIRRAGSF